MLNNRIFDLSDCSNIISYDMILLSVFHWVTLSCGHLRLFHHNHLPRFCKSFRFEAVEIHT